MNIKFTHIALILLLIAILVSVFNKANAYDTYQDYGSRRAYNRVYEPQRVIINTGRGRTTDLFTDTLGNVSGSIYDSDRGRIQVEGTTDTFGNLEIELFD